jgi:hypothetical protein
VLGVVDCAEGERSAAFLREKQTAIAAPEVTEAAATAGEAVATPPSFPIHTADIPRRSDCSLAKRCRSRMTCDQFFGS